MKHALKKLRRKAKGWYREHKALTLVSVLTICMVGVLVSLVSVWGLSSDDQETSGRFSEGPTYVVPGKIYIEEYEPGIKTTQPFSVHNGEKETRVFAISYRVPDRLVSGHEYVDASEWVKLSTSTLELLPKEVNTVRITIEVPEEIELPDKWEFWISAIDTGQTGFVRVELCTKYLVTMG